MCVLGNGTGIAWKGKTGKGGTAKVRISEESIGRNHEVEVAFSFPFTWACRKRVNLEKSMGKVVNLVLPPCGSFGIRVVGRDGKPWKEPVFLSLSIINGNEISKAVKEVRGKIFFPMVELGSRLEAFPLEKGNAFIQAFHSWEGPKVPGERKWGEIVIHVRPRIRARALDSKGRPLTKQVLFFERGAFSRNYFDYYWTKTILTDSKGFFFFPQKSYDCLYRITAWKRTGLDGMPQGLQCVVEFPGARGEGDFFFGDVYFREMRVLAGGKVLDGKGKGVSHARVALEEEALSGGKDGRDLFHGFTDPEGKFLIRGTPTGGTLGALKITLVKDGYREVSGRIDPGETGLIFRMKKLPVVEGLVDVDRGVSLGDLSVVAVKKGEDLVRSFLKWESSTRGRYHLSLPSAGTWKISVRARKKDLWEKRIQVLDGGRFRLDIPLQGKIDLYMLKAFDKKGHPVSAFWIYGVTGEGKKVEFPPVGEDPKEVGLRIFLLPGGSRILKVESDELEVQYPLLKKGKNEINEVVLLVEKKGKGKKKDRSSGERGRRNGPFFRGKLPRRIRMKLIQKGKGDRAR